MQKLPMQTSNQTKASNKQHIQGLKASWKRMEGMELLSLVHIGPASELQQCPKTALKLPAPSPLVADAALPVDDLKHQITH